MEFSYYNKNHQVTEINVHVGKKWGEQKTSNKLLNSLFNYVDNGDGVVQEEEFILLQNLLKKSDSLIKQSANNKIVDCKELGKLFTEIQKDNVDKKVYKIDLNNYSYENLLKRYPKDKYDILMVDVGYWVTTKKGKPVLDVFFSDKAPQLFIYDKKGRVKYQEYDKNGVLVIETKANSIEKMRDDDIKFPLADELYKDITKKNSLRLPTTGAKIEEHANLINSQNCIDILSAYKQMYGNDFLEDLDSEVFIMPEKRSMRNRVRQHIEQSYKKACGYKDSFTNKKSQVVHKSINYKGDIYNISCKNDKLTVTNKNNGQTKTIDLEKLTDDFDKLDAIQLKGYIQNLPGEVLMDIASECTYVWDGQSFLIKKLDERDHLDNADAYYQPRWDDITLHVDENNYYFAHSLVHELGHAIDNTLTNGSSYNQTSKNKFQKIFNSEIARYKKSGGVIFNKNEPSTYKSSYCTANASEMFSECYAYLMTGSVPGTDAETIERFFPGCLRETMNIVKTVRSLPAAKRHEA